MKYSNWTKAELIKQLEVLEVSEKLIKAPIDVVNYIRAAKDIIKDANKEHFIVLLLNSKNKIVHVDTVSVGGLSSTAVHPREVFKLAISHSAAGIIVLHNHPSGDCSPSTNDDDITESLVACGKVLNIPVLDHLIIDMSGIGFYSYSDKGRL